MCQKAGSANPAGGHDECLNVRVFFSVGNSRDRSIARDPMEPNPLLPPSAGRGAPSTYSSLVRRALREERFSPNTLTSTVSTLRRAINSWRVLHSPRFGIEARSRRSGGPPTGPP